MTDFSFYRTIVDSPQWQRWSEHTRETLEFDMAECEEGGEISPEHFQAFLKFVEDNNL